TFIEDNRLLIAHLADSTVEIWDLGVGQRVALEGAERGSARCIALSDNGRWLFSLSGVGSGRVCQLPRGNTVAGPLPMRHRVACAALSADGRQLALVDEENALWIWDADSGRDRMLVPSLRSEGIVRQIQWSPDSRLVLTVGDHE